MTETNPRQEKGKAIALKSDLIRLSDNYYHVHSQTTNREKVVRGIKKVDSVIIDGYQLYHNYVRPHLALKGKTPADKAGIIIEGNDKWKTIIENAQKDSRD